MTMYAQQLNFVGKRMPGVFGIAIRFLVRPSVGLAWQKATQLRAAQLRCWIEDTAYTAKVQPARVSQRKHLHEKGT